jgi:hypothetical protein
MARLALTPAVLAGAPTPVQITDLIAAGTLGSNTGVSFSNSGTEMLFVAVAAGGSTCNVKIGTTVEDQAVADKTPALTAGKTHVLPPFPRDFNQSGANAGQVFVDFGTPANVTVLLVRFQGVS